MLSNEAVACIQIPYRGIEICQRYNACHGKTKALCQQPPVKLLQEDQKA